MQPHLDYGLQLKKDQSEGNKGERTRGHDLWGVAEDIRFVLLRWGNLGVVLLLSTTSSWEGAERDRSADPSSLVAIDGIGKKMFQAAAGEVQIGIGKILRAVKQWDRLPRELIQSPNLVGVWTTVLDECLNL